jgi:hypothetical protein
MTALSRDTAADPRWVDTILDWRGTWLAARIALTGAFILGAGALGVLTAIATVTANSFWALEGHARFVAANTFFEHISIIAGFVMAALIAEHAECELRRRGGVPANRHPHGGRRDPR